VTEQGLNGKRDAPERAAGSPVAGPEARLCSGAVGAVVQLEPRTIAVAPAGQARVSVRIRNAGSVVDQFSLAVVGDSAAWSTVEPPTLSLFPGAEGAATVTFSPPRLPSVPAGAMPFGLRVESKEDPSGSVVEEGTLELEPFTDVSAELVPRTSRGSTGATHDLAVDNRGNVPLDVALSAVDPDRLLEFDIRPPAIRADPGTAMFAKVRVKPARTFWRGSPVSRPFQVHLALPDGPPVTVDGTLLQTSILPAWAPRAALMTVALLVGAVVLWLALLRPAIESTARAQTEDALAAVGITPPPSGAAASGAGSGGGGASPSASGSGGESPSPSGSTGASATPPPDANGLTLSDGRLVAGGTPFTASPGTTLYVTDLVFSNPSDTATGDIRLERANEPLLVLRLENFRDLDFHFVTPIVVAPGKTLALVCPTGCTGAAIYYSGYQR
jgi:hypothetical protein